MLGLRRGADPADIDAAHRRLASRAHPDRWLGAAVEDRDAARTRYQEVNAAHRTLRGANARGGEPAEVLLRRRPPQPQPPPPPPRWEPPMGGLEQEQVGGVESDPPALSRRLLAGAGAGALLLAALITVGLLSSSPDGGRQRRVLGPLAHRVWEAERQGAFGAVWDVADDEVHRLISREDFIAHLEACPPKPPPRDVARIGKVGGGRWEVESVDPSGEPGLSYFTQVDDYRFKASVTDPDLLAFLEAPVSTAPEQEWCRR